MIRKLLIGLFLLSSITSAYAGIETDTLTSTTLKNSGNIGIGTTNPTQKLDITGNIAISGTVDGVDVSSLPSGSGTANYITKWSSSSAFADSMLYDNATNVGIGTTNPGQKLEVNGAVKLNGNVVLNGNWLSNDNGNEGVYVDASGNVGIGTTGTTTAQFNTGSIRIGTSTTSGYVLTADNTGIGTWQVATSGTSSSYRRSFTNGDLSAGSLTVTHSLGQKYCQVTIYDDSDEIVIATGVVATDSNTTTIDLSEFGTISGTWNVVVTK